tara:strand:+ start:27 stop:734 length:708 start_codon:yes stop_codon:yes gene_type:complete
MQYILGLLILGAVLWYFLSEPFAANVNKAYEENTTWNASTINDNKEAYIDSMYDKVDVIEKTLLDERLNLKIKLEQFKREQKETNSNISNLANDMDRWKNDYKILDGRTVGEVQTSYNKETLGDLLLQADLRVKAEKAKLNYYPNAIINLEGLLARAEEGLKEVDKKRVEIDIARTNLRLTVGENTVKDIVDSLNSLSDSATALVSDISKVSLDNARARDRSLSSRSDLESILSD